MSKHGPTEARKIRYPGGKDGWYRVDCTDPECEYTVTEAYPGHAERRVIQHAKDKK